MYKILNISLFFIYIFNIALDSTVKSEIMTREEELEIMGCELFSLDDGLSMEKKKDIMEWYKNLSEQETEFVDIIREEATYK